jgi:peptidyl-prolyl cis-trans isomerase D
MAGDVPAPTAEQVQAFYNDRKSTFMAPEYRAVTLLAVDAGAIAKPETVTDADARQLYEQEKAKFGTPERRTIQQIAFPSQQDAEAAFNRIKEGATFEAIATERNIAESDLNLGAFAKTEMLDPAVAEAAFALQQGAVSGPVAGRFGPVLVRVTAIQPEAVKPFEEVAGQIRGEIAQQRGQGEIESMHDQIEDMRASARPLADIAKEKGLAVVQVPAVDKSGLDKTGKTVDMPGREAVLNAAFASDIGVDNEAVRIPTGGYVWYDVTGIEPSREKTLDEVRDQVVRLWREDEIAKRLSEKARLFTERLDKGEAIEAVAQEAGAQVKAATDLARRTAKDDLMDEAVNRIFSVPVGKAGNVANGTDTRVVFKVTAATVPPMMTTTQDAQRIEEQLRTGMSDDLIAQYIAQVRQDLGVTINQQAIRQVTGGEL